MFLIVLGADYLGLSSTLTQLLGALSISELGIQTVIIYRLYKPVAEDRYDEICDIMTVYRTLYRVIAVVISVGALAILPFLKYVITNVEISMTEVSISWLIMACTSSLSYLLSYNNALLFADQKQYRVSFFDMLINIFFSLLNIWLLYLLGNIYLYFTILLIRTITSNIMVLMLRKKYYTWFHFQKPPEGLLRGVLLDTKDMFAGKLAGYVFNSTDNVVISSFIGTAAVGFFGNYVTIVSSVKAVVYSIIGPIQNLTGNFLVSENKGDREGFLRNFTYITFFIESCILVPTALLINDFVILFYGSEYQLDASIVFMIIIDAYFALGQATVGCMVDVSGLFKEQKRFYCIGALINISLSIVGAKIIGIEGVILGTIIGNIYHWYMRAYYSYKKVLDTGKNGLIRYFVLNFRLLVFFALEWMVLFFVFNKVFGLMSFFTFIVKGFISVACMIIGHVICFRKDNEFKYMLNLIRSRKGI